MLNAVRFIHNLRESGLESRQAEAIVDVIHQSLQHNFATREDMAKLNGKVDEVNLKIDYV